MTLIQIVETVVTCIGSCFILKWLLQILIFGWKMLRCFILPNIGFEKDLTKYGRWAVVTGSTEGIGRQYALELAKRGLDIVLISLPERLDEVAREIEDKFSVKTKTIAFDFSVQDADYGVITEQLHELDIGILVNNVGLGPGKQSLFQNLNPSSLHDMINVNIVPQVILTHSILQGMIVRKRGMIVHMASGMSYFPIPAMHLYPSTKAFMSHFAQGLQIEAQSYPYIHHQLVTPHFVATSMMKSMKNTSFAPSAEVFVRSAVKTIGVVDITTGYWKQDIEAVVWKAMPDFLRNLALMKMISKRVRQPKEKKVE